MRYVYTSYIALCTLCVIAVVRVWYAYTHPYVPKVALNITTECRGQILRYPDIRENFQYLYVKTSVDSPCEGELILVRAKNFHALIPGDTIMFRGRIEPVQNFASESDREFNLKGFRAKDGVYVIAENPSIDYRGSVKCGLFLYKTWYICTIRSLYIIKTHISEQLQYVLPYPESSLALGITLGEKQGLGKELLEQFRVAGLSHIVVLSGFNVTILAYAIGTMLYGRLYRGIRTLSIGGVLIVFALFVGLGSTVVRTVIMALVWAGAEFFYRRPRSLRVIAVSALSMIVYEPLIALYDPSFHLSFLALIGVVYISPCIHKASKKLVTLKDGKHSHTVINSVLATFATTLSAFMITAPYIWWMMGEVTWWGLLTNIVVIPTIPIVMFLTALVVPITILSHAGGIVLAYPLSLILSWILYVARIPEIIALE